MKKYMTALLAAAFLIVAMLLISACAVPASPAVPACEPLPIASAGVSGAQGGQGSPYAATLYGGLATISNATNDIRLRWPDDEPSQDTRFRADFAVYANTIICTANALLAVPPPDASYHDFAVAFDKVMNDQADIAELGRTAVQQRNVTKYREWIDRQNAQPGRLRDAFALLPR
ncbi:MAG TPA: hypothetical protein VN697_13080 [Tepidiformaceae bacterium]|nr:hypothetical protein [Tepidiformaceae bacterium]